MTVLPMTAGLVGAVLLGSRWPVMVRVAQVVGPCAGAGHGGHDVDLYRFITRRVVLDLRI
ncbi:hypothetical protein ACIBKY_05015 [Nonomuraea sp. NPDC050394]|uniref:hypothetical protein n=1 Tax=Nonomuraea sp. NPDC050394 TaxID=3364363 RepID=UPI0037AC8AA3